MKTKNIRQSIILQANSKKVFNELKTREAEKIKKRNVEKIKDKRIVQKWKANLSCWPQNHDSKVVFKLREDDDKTILSLYHHDVPEACMPQIKEKWKSEYWDAMKAKFKSA